jgi:hypothetical protein
MIEQEIIKQYPSLVARPYLLIKDDLQRKDMQRFWFENTISFLAVLSAAQLVQFYKELKSKEGKSEKDLEIIKSIQEHKSLTMVGLEHMALGKWVMMLRETTKFLLELNAANTISELVDFYHGKNGKNNAKIIDKLVSIRNDDAHGNPIPEDKLNAELDKRQQLIDSLLQELSFLKDYQLILPEKLEIEGSKQFYICKRFVGASIVNSKETFDFSPQLSEVMLVNETKKDARLALSPLLLYLGVQDDENNFLGIFSKYASKDATEAKYLNLDGSSTIDLVNFGQDQELDLISEKQSYSEIYSDPESFQVNLDIEMKLEESIINIKEESSFSLTLENRKSTDIEEMKLVLNIPKNIDLLDPLPENENYKIAYVDNQLTLEFSSFEDNANIKIEPVKFSVSEQGSYNFDSGQVLYSYFRSLADAESGQLTDEDVQFDGNTIEVRDPNSRDKMVPVINISKGFVDDNGTPIQSVKIGDDFVFRVHVSNIGFSSAKDVTIDLVFPDNVSLKQGKETIKLGQLNPFEEKIFKYVLTSHVPDIYTISMQNVLYSDSQGVRYATRCADDHFVIVRSDLIKEFVYDVKAHIDDLYIDEEEKANISQMIETLDASIDIQAYEVYKEAETEAVINIVRELIDRVAAKKELKVVERVYEEGKRDKKITGMKPRKFLVYSTKEMPFFAINLSKGYEPEFFALKTNIDKRFDKISLKQAMVTDKSYTLDHCIEFSEIKYNEKYGKNFFSQWLNIVMTRFEKEYLIWKDLTTKISKYYGFNLQYISGQFGAYPSSSIESGVRGSSMITLMDRENSQNYFVGFEVKPTKSYKEVMGKMLEEKPFIKFLNETIDSKMKTRFYNSENLSYYIHNAKSDRITRIPSVNQFVKDEKTMIDMLNSVKDTWNHLCLSNSLNLLESEEFKDQKFLKEMKQFVHDLFKKGFSLRSNAKNSDMLDIYPLKHFKPHTATEKDCIGFIKKNYSSWQIFMDFFVDEIDDALLEQLSLINSTIVSDKVRWIKTDIQTIEQFILATDSILKQADIFQPSQLAIWPHSLQKEMIINHGQSDSGFFIILQYLLSGTTNYLKIKEKLQVLQLDKELDRTLQRAEQFETDAGYEAPLYTEGSDDTMIVKYKPFLENSLKEMYEADARFDYLEDGPALFRIYSQQIASAYEDLAGRAPHPQGVLYRGFKDIQSKFFKKYELVISPIKDKQIIFYLLIDNCKEQIDDKVQTVFKEIAKQLGIELEISRSGGKKQHVKVVHIYKFNDFSNDLEAIQEFTNNFFNAMRTGLEKISE